MASLFQRQANRPKVDIENIFSDAPIDQSLRQHLFNVYAALAVTLTAAAVGSLFHLKYNMGGALSSLGAMGLLIYLAMDPDRYNVQKRMTVMAGFGFFKGLSIGPLVAAAADIDPSIILTAFLGTASIFVCFTLSALYAPRYQYLALGGVLGTAVSFLFWISILNIFFRSMFAFNVSLYLGLFVFCGYVLYDTQVIVERFRAGDNDFTWHAVELFIDFVAIFVRILIILMNNAEKDKKRSNSRR